ncbi:MAG: hypothetical protein NC212_09005 [Staphylococcus sp.]|nr:hypothetical protein [Staphylococcus sp.]
MPLPAIVEIAEKHLFSDRDKMVAAGIPEASISHLLRLRDIYNYWLSFPNKKDRDIVSILKSRYGICDSTARSDLKLIKILLGNMEQATKEYHRYRFVTIINRAIELAELQNNPEALIKAADKYAKYMQLDKDDERINVLDKLVPLRLAFTDDPEVIGISRVPNAKEKIKAVKERYWTDETVDVEFEEIDANIDELFNSGSFSHGDAG